MIDSNQTLPGFFLSCRAASVGFSPEYAECFSRDHTDCNYRKPLGQSCHQLCSHPAQDAIVEHTKMQDGLD